MNNKILLDKFTEAKKLIRTQQYSKLQNYINFKIQQKNNNSQSPDINGKKYLVIMACHCINTLKFDTIKTNLRYFGFENIHKIVINSENTPYSNALRDICKRHNNTKYYEIPNNNYIDFGKWVYVLQNLVNYNDYDFIIFTNDSFYIHKSINHYLNLAVKHNVELFGYNDSTQVRYHYQSYLFTIRKDAIIKFINNVTAPGPIINEAFDIVINYEVKMTDWFSSTKSFLKIGNCGLDLNKNIFFTNDQLYLPLKNSGLLPFTKLKRIS